MDTLGPFKGVYRDTFWDITPIRENQMEKTKKCNGDGRV